MLIIGAAVLFFGGVISQFAYNFVLVKPYVPTLTKGGDGKLTQMLYESENLEDSYFADAALIASNLEGTMASEGAIWMTASGNLRSGPVWMPWRKTTPVSI